MHYYYKSNQCGKRQLFSHSMQAHPWMILSSTPTPADSKSPWNVSNLLSNKKYSITQAMNLDWQCLDKMTLTLMTATTLSSNPWQSRTWTSFVKSWSSVTLLWVMTKLAGTFSRQSNSSLIGWWSTVDLRDITREDFCSQMAEVRPNTMKAISKG